MEIDLSEVENFLKKSADLIVISDEFEGVSPLKRPVKLYLEWNLDYPVDFICYTISFSVWILEYLGSLKNWLSQKSYHPCAKLESLNKPEFKTDIS